MADRWEGRREKAESSGLMLSMSLEDEFLHLLGIVVVCLIILFLCALIGFCVWRRKRKQPGKWRVPKTCCCPT